MSYKLCGVGSRDYIFTSYGPARDLLSAVGTQAAGPPQAGNRRLMVLYGPVVSPNNIGKTNVELYAGLSVVHEN